MPNENVTSGDSVSNGSNTKYCENCGVIIDISSDHFKVDRGGRYYCEDCSDSFFADCGDCGEETHENYLTHCPECEDVFCPDCYNRTTLDNIAYCSSECAGSASRRRIERERIEQEERDRERSTETQSAGGGKGKIITSKRRFGVELELIYKDSNDTDQLLDVMENKWNNVGDSSISGTREFPNTIEINSNILGEVKGENTILKVCEVLNRADFRVNQSCGYHLHLDARDILRKPESEKVYVLKNILAFYLACDDVILSILPESRRTNAYCQRISDLLSFDEVFMMSDFKMNILEMIWYRIRKGTVGSTREELNIVEDNKGSRYHNTRRAGVNFHPLFRNGHIEIRYHSGTRNAKKILFWVALHQTIIDKINDGKINEAGIKELKRMLFSEDKIKHFLKLLGASKEMKKYVLDRYNKFYQLNKKEEKSVCVE